MKANYIIPHTTKEENICVRFERAYSQDRSAPACLRVLVDINDEFVDVSDPSGLSDDVRFQIVELAEYYTQVVETPILRAALEKKYGGQMPIIRLAQMIVSQHPMTPYKLHSDENFNVIVSPSCFAGVSRITIDFFEYQQKTRTSHILFVPEVHSPDEVCNLFYAGRLDEFEDIVMIDQDVYDTFLKLTS